jgi:hypothetical protein
MRISVSHGRTKQEVVEEVDRSFTGLFQGADLPVKLVDQQKSWNGSTMTFSLTAKMGFFSTPIKGTVEVTDRDIIVDADLGMLERMIPQEKAQEVLTSRVRGLLKGGK